MRYPTTTLAVMTSSLAACAHPGTAPREHQGRDGTVDGARPLPYAEGDREGQPVSGVVTSRGGDPTDWYVFEVTRACSSVGLELRWKGARDRTQVLIDIVDPIGQHHRKQLARRGGVLVENAPVGHYHVRVAIEGDAAAHYVLAARDMTTNMECGDAVPPTALRVQPAAPAKLPSPWPGTVAAVIIAWETWLGPDDQPRERARLGAGVDEGIATGDTGALVDADGASGGTVRIIASEPHTSLAELQVPPPPEENDITRLDPRIRPIPLRPRHGYLVGVYVAVKPPPTPPLTVSVIDRWRDRAGVMVVLAAGEREGVAGGWRGRLGGDGGRQLGDIVILGLEPHRSVARITDRTLVDILDAQQATIAPAP